MFPNLKASNLSKWVKGWAAMLDASKSAGVALRDESGSTFCLKPRADVFRSLKQGYQ